MIPNFSNLLLWISCLPIFLGAADLKHDPGIETTKIENMLDSSIEYATKAKDLLKGHCLKEPRDCEDILLCGQKSSGVYRIRPVTRLDLGCVEVFCDMDTDGGGWTVFQRRGDYGRASDYFYKDWESYKDGFGDLSQDFWLGNDVLYALSNQKQISLRIDMKDLEENKRHAVYDTFWIDSEDYNYTLHVTDYTGTAGDGLSLHSGRMFSTRDRDKDTNSAESCANKYKGAWWYQNCHNSNLNGLYLKGFHPSNGEGVNWDKWRGHNYSLPFAEMKLRKTFFEKFTATKRGWK